MESRPACTRGRTCKLNTKQIIEPRTILLGSSANHRALSLPDCPMGRSRQTFQSDSPVRQSRQTFQSDGPVSRSRQTFQSDGPVRRSNQTVQSDGLIRRSQQTVPSDGPIRRSHQTVPSDSPIRLTEQALRPVCTQPELSFCTQQPDFLSRSLALWISATICLSWRIHGANLAPRWIRSSCYAAENGWLWNGKLGNFSWMINGYHTGWKCCFVFRLHGKEIATNNCIQCDRALTL